MQTRDYKAIISEIFHSVQRGDNVGMLPSYIPELASISPEKFGCYFFNFKGESFGIGDYQEKFSIQSIVKVLSMSLAYKIIGNDLWKRVGVEPSGTSFNSLMQLENDKGIPRNPFINAGAIVVCDVLLSVLKNPMDDFLNFVRNLADNPAITFSNKVASSEKSVGYRNFATGYYLKSLGNLENNPLDVLEFYFNICSIEMTCSELAKTFAFLANNGITPHSEEAILNESFTKRATAVMLTCGFYDESGEFAFRVGLPGKSGVGGGIAAVMPDHYSIAIWSPVLNDKGNSYRGMKFLEEFTTQTAVSVF